jgi:DNA-binding GntR family transcriptional regulator
MTANQRRPSRASGKTHEPSACDRAIQHLKEQMFHGRMRPGDRVVQEQVATTLGISRVPVREALIALEREGWVRLDLHRGAVVTGLDRAAVRNYYDLFGVLYGFAANKALQRPHDDLVDQLAVIARKAKHADDPNEISQLAIEFRALTVDAAASPQLKVLLRSMSGLLPGVFFSLVPDAIAAERSGFASIVRVMRAGDGPAAEAEYRKLMRRLGKLVVRSLEDRGLFET